MPRGGGKLTDPETGGAGEDFLYGTKGEVRGRLEDEYPATESHFSQIRPSTNVKPHGRNIDEIDGSTIKPLGAGIGKKVVRNGQLGRNIHRGNP
jgi:hypothetical protein